MICILSLNDALGLIFYTSINLWIFNIVEQDGFVL